MEYAAIDLHTAQCQIRIVSEDGQVVEDRRVPSRDRLRNGHALQVRIEHRGVRRTRFSAGNL